ncbi:hypothetical protein GCM10009798_24500 [Nocardioides panacihumi]|uniref:Uncharacterized protein n=1 Tax=Nocardioides panacihumi TaxID=400774 RepID=A0ABN2R4I5_9ACTN
MSGLLVARLTLRPTAQAMPWSPVVAVAATGLLAAWAAGSLSARTTVLPIVVAGTLAAAATATLRDPADELLRPLPTSVPARRLLRAALVALVVVPVTLGVARLTPGPGAGAATIALGLTGLAVASWLPERRVLVASAVPVCWVMVGLALQDRLGALGDATAWWWTHPWQVTVAAVLALGTAVTTGRSR